MLKKTAVAASILLIAGLAGGMLTFKSGNRAEEITEDKTIQNEFDEIKISAKEASVEVLPTSNSQASVELSGKSANYILSANVEGSVLQVDVDYKQKKLYNFDFASAFLALKVYVPEKEYKSLQADSSNSSVELHDLQAKAVRVQTDNGRIKMSKMQSDEVNAEADNGTIDLTNVKALQVAAETDNGKILLDGVEGKLSGKADNGSISLKTKDMDRSIDFETDNGKIKIQTDKEPENAIFDINIDNGKADIFGESKWDTLVGDGDYLIKLTAENGKITVKK